MFTTHKSVCVMVFSMLTEYNNTGVTHQEIKNTESEYVKWDAYVTMIVEPVQHTHTQTTHTQTQYLHTLPCVYKNCRTFYLL